MSVCPFDVNKVFERLNEIKIGINLLLIYPYIPEDYLFFYESERNFLLIGLLQWSFEKSL